MGQTRSIRERESFFVSPKMLMKYLKGESGPWISIPLIYKRGYCQVEVSGIFTNNNMNLLLKILNELLLSNKNPLDIPDGVP